MYALIRRFLDKNPDWKGEILDVGAGTGDLLVSLDSKRFKKHAVDISDTAFKILKKNKKLQSKNARYKNKLKPGMLIEIGVLNNNYYYKCDETIYFGFE